VEEFIFMSIGMTMKKGNAGETKENISRPPGIASTLTQIP